MNFNDKLFISTVIAIVSSIVFFIFYDIEDFIEKETSSTQKSIKSTLK